MRIFIYLILVFLAAVGIYIFGAADHGVDLDWARKNIQVQAIVPPSPPVTIDNDDPAPVTIDIGLAIASKDLSFGNGPFTAKFTRQGNLIFGPNGKSFDFMLKANAKANPRSNEVSQASSKFLRKGELKIKLDRAGRYHFNVDGGLVERSLRSRNAELASHVKIEFRDKDDNLIYIITQSGASALNTNPAVGAASSNIAPGPNAHTIETLFDDVELTVTVEAHLVARAAASSDKFSGANEESLEGSISPPGGKFWVQPGDDLPDAHAKGTLDVSVNISRDF